MGNESPGNSKGFILVGFQLPFSNSRKEVGNKLSEINPMKDEQNRHTKATGAVKTRFTLTWGGVPGSDPRPIMAPV